MIRREFSDAKNKPAAILTSYGVRFWSVMSICVILLPRRETAAKCFLERREKNEGYLRQAETEHGHRTPARNARRDTRIETRDVRRRRTDMVPQRSWDHESRQEQQRELGRQEVLGRNLDQVTP